MPSAMILLLIDVSRENSEKFNVDFASFLRVLR